MNIELQLVEYFQSPKCLELSTICERKPHKHNKQETSADADVTENTKKVPAFLASSKEQWSDWRRDYGLICPIFITLG